jgi:hypothetical protein
MTTVAHSSQRVKIQREFKAKVLAALVTRGWRQVDLARAIRKGRTAVSQCINAGKFPRVREAIESQLNLN